LNIEPPDVDRVPLEYLRQRRSAASIAESTCDSIDRAIRLLLEQLGGTGVLDPRQCADV
jgi:hypothetical protein